MKVFLAISLIVVCLCFVNGEITPRFPGTQPIVVTGDSTGFTDFEDKTTIDSFSADTSPPVIIRVPAGGAPPEITQQSYDRDSGILGGERDVIFVAQEADPNVVFSAGASGGVFAIACPRGGSGFAKLQYDGLDSSNDLTISPGLGGFDLSTGDAIGFRILALTDIETIFFLTVVDTQGRSATVQGDVPGGVELFSYFVDFDTFLSTIDFTSVAAIEFEVEAFENVDFTLDTFVTYGGVVVGNCFSGAVLPCDIDYYRIQTLTNVQVGDYLKFYFNTTGEDSHPDSTGVFYFSSSNFDDLQSELSTNDKIVDTLGELPGRNNYIYKCEEDCAIELVWSQLQDTTYYIGVEGRGDGISLYTICYQYNSVPVFQLFDQVPQPIFFDQRADYPPADRIFNYRFYVIDVPDIRYSPGTYLTVNVSRVSPLPGTIVRVMYESLPETAVDTGILDNDPDLDNNGQQVDDMIYPWCVDVQGRDEDFPSYVHPVKYDTRVPCECETGIQLFGDGPFYQLTCQLYIDPCRFLYGNYYISVELPEREDPYNSLDISGELNYTITARVVQPVINEITRNETVKGFLEPELALHFFVDVFPKDVIDGETHFFVHVSNVRNAFIDVYVHQGLGGTGNSLAGGPEACVPANATCHTCDACNIVIEKCHFVPGTWYISVSVSYDQEAGEFEIFDLSRLPVTFTLRADWSEDPVPQPLLAGVPVSKYLGASLYDFYVIDVPATIDTWLIIELYAQACDTEVILSVLHGSLPGGECYSRPDFYCITGDPKEKVWTTGPPTFYVDEPVQRESCSFMIQTCELQAGPLFISVYGHHTGYAAYGDTTFYQVPVHYTLWADFDVALSLTSAVSYSETVYEKQYQHYYVRADQVKQGSWLSVEITNIRHGIPQTIEAFVNYNYLAGNCPCYDHLYNCTGSAPCSSIQQAGAIPHLVPDWEQTTLTCCTIVVPASDFRPGVWYVSVLGVNEDQYQYTTPIGYTLTVTVHDAPEFYPLILGQTFAGEVPQWNHTLEYAHFRLGAEAVPLNDLVIKVTFVQNCDFMGKHDDTRDSVWLFVNKGSPATAIGWDYSCQANIPGDSYCTIVIPHCEWSGDDYFIAVQGDYSATFTGRFTLRAFSEEVRDIQLSDGIPFYDRVSEGRYKHFFIETSAPHDQYLDINIYTNSDQDTVTAYVNHDSRAGTSPCFDNFASCSSKCACSWQLLACEMEPGRYYISVAGDSSQFYETSVEFTLTATHRPVSLRLFNAEPFTGHLYNVGDVQHYSFELDTVDETFHLGAYIKFTVDNIKHGYIQAYGQFGSLAGRCPCYTYEYSCANSEGVDFCEIIIPTCDLQTGEYFFSVWATELASPSPLIYQTPIGFVIEVDVVDTRIIKPTVAVGRNTANTEVSERLFNERYLSYEFSYTQEDYDNGYHIVVEITQVQDGALYVYYNPTTPADRYCHLAQICTSGLFSGVECHWQLPFSLVRPSDEPNYITVEARTGRDVAAYNILIFKQAVPSILANPSFSLDDDDDTQFNGQLTSFYFPTGAEVNITHVDRQEPNGWTQFVILSDVSHSDSLRGDLLEVFFYRITNNPGEPLDFNVYIYADEPAGAHECCGDDPTELGSCQGAPTLHTVDTTTSVNNGPDLITHTCTFGTLGSGNGQSNNAEDPFYGERCTVRVWPCEFHKYCNRTVNFWVSVVPLAPTDPASPGPGLQYSLQFRTRNIRLLDGTGTALTSTDLTSFINTYDFEPSLPNEPFVVSTTSTESQGWASFYVDWQRDYGRLSIQTLFSQGEAEVFIHGDTFASEGVESTCWDYRCSTSSDVDCSTDGRFIVTEACSLYDKVPDRYWITVRNTGNDDADDVHVQFRIYSLDLPATISIPQHPSELLPYTDQSGQSVFTGVTGIEGDNYVFYQMTIDDQDIELEQSWVIQVNFNNNDNAGIDAGYLEIYIRYGADAGLYGYDLSQSYYGFVGEGAHNYLYSCQITEPDTVCTFQIPSCALKKGFWYIGIRNPVFALALTPSELPDFTIATWISDPPVTFDIDEQVASTVLDNLGLLQHFKIDITTDHVDFDTREDLSGSYWTNYLRFQFDNIIDQTGLSIGAIEAWINYGFIAGSPDEYPCLGASIGELTCTDSSCFIDVVPCESFSGGFKLITGTYYLSVRQVVPSTYTLLARVYFNEYTLIPSTQTITGTGHRAGTTNVYYSISPSTTDLDNSGDGSGNYRYVIDPTAGGDDDIPDNQYFIFNITAFDDTFWDSDDTVHLEIWRDDCTRWHCEITGPDSWCTVDAVGLAPCSSKAGRFYLRAENLNDVPFTINVYQNETTVQTLLDSQIITEITYPYEYQEYYYEATDVGQGATLTVTVCSICGDVQVFIREDTPAGPVPGNFFNFIFHPLDSCSIDSVAVFGPKDTTFENENNCGQIFLDTCTYEQRGYYIAVRGVAQSYPDETNPNLYTPIKYEIQAVQTTINFTEVTLDCPKVIEWDLSWNAVPRQYFVDIETADVSDTIVFQLRLPEQLLIDGSVYPSSSLYVSPNTANGYTSDCFNLYECSIDELSGYCQVTISCLTPGRWYIYADAPRGSEIVVNRYEHYIPVIYTDLIYHGTVSVPSIDGSLVNDFYFPVNDGKEIYRFDLDPNGDENYYERFFTAIQVVALYGEVYTSLYAGCDYCSSFLVADLFSNGVIEITLSDLIDYDYPTTWWLVIEGFTQDCELHAIQYEFIVRTRPLINYLNADTIICDTLDISDGIGRNNYRLRPREVEWPQQSILNIVIDDYSGGFGSVVIKDGYVAVEGYTYDFPAANDYYSEDSSPVSIDWICGYKDLYLSVEASEFTFQSFDYKLTTTKVHVPVKELKDDSIYYADDDDDDACPHEHDFYIFKTAQPLGHHAGSFFRVLVDSLFNTEVYVNKHTFAWEQCHDSGYGANNPEETGTTSVNVYDFCDFADGVYYITVVSDGPYYIYTDIRDDAKELTIGEVFRDTLEPGQYQMYKLEICSDWLRPDDRLVIDIADVEHADVFGWVQRDSNAGFRSYKDDFFGGVVTSTCAIDTARANFVQYPDTVTSADDVATFTSTTSSYDYLLVPHYYLHPGTYYILIRAGVRHEGSAPVRNCKDVSFRLFPRLLDFEIEPTHINPNVVITDQVDAYYINRIAASAIKFANYYQFMPLMEDQGFFEQVSFGVLRLVNIDGGYLSVRVLRDRLAINYNAYITGEIEALSKYEEIDSFTHIQYGRRPYNLQRVVDFYANSYDFTCDGSASDFCAYQNIGETSIALWLPSCYYIWADFFIAVEPIDTFDPAYSQFYQDKPITYDLVVENYRDYILLQPNTNHLGQFSDGNWGYDFYYSISPEPQSMRWRVVVTSGEGVLVTVRDHRCPRQSNCEREIWCDASYSVQDRNWSCDIEIPTRASHTGELNYFVAVYGNNATYSIAFWRGRENCHEFTGSGRNEGLDFCAGLVPYATWRWDNYANLDDRAQCYFEQLYDHFKVQPCWTGVSVECNATLQAYACYETFHACDAQGFQVGTCRDACDAVEYECVNRFESVDLEHLECSSNRYIDSHAQTCTGSHDQSFSTFDEHGHFLGDVPDVILFKSSPTVGDSFSSATSLSLNFVLMSAVALVVLFI